MNKKELNSLFDDAIDELEITYDVYFNIERYRPRCVHTMHRLLSSGLEGGKVLVLGSDEKPFTMMCSKLGFHADGISFNQSASDVTENENRTASSVTEIIKNIKDDFDIIICDDILQYIQYPQEMLILLKGHLRPGGLLMLTTPNVARGTSRLWLLSGRNIYPLPSVSETEEGEILRLIPYREYTLRELEKLVTGMGMELMQSEFIIGKSVNANMWPPMPVKEYLLQTFFLAVQKVVAPLRNYLFAAARNPLSKGEEVT
ncbi:MAG TPA: methyltransferase domain-containing protein [Thermodesulfovibrionales bacterium]|nr:methyltransferase domain-containing protein [Thermodesulfovibrionales bacterium]